jgi:uncharacterized membrane protein
MARFCTQCGTSMEDSAAFCPKCGHASPGVTATGGAMVATPATTGLADNVAGALAYVTIVPAIVFLVVEPYNRNRFVRFHAFQSLCFGIGWAILHQVLYILLPWFLWRLWGLIDLALFIVGVMLIVKAYQGQKWKLPVIGDFAEKQANAV